MYTLVMETIIKKTSENPGKIIAIFCGVHGNERAGIIAVEKALQELVITAGTVYFVFANPRAIEIGKRFVEKNLNRCFYHGQSGDTYEEQRAQELMRLLDTCDALLDVHASNTPDTIPFIITDSGFDVAQVLPFEIVARGFDLVEPGGTDGYMKNSDKVGVCVECGFSGASEQYSDLAYQSIVQFLKFYGAIDGVAVPIHNQKLLHVDRVQKVTSDNYMLTRTFSDFEVVPEGLVIARDDTHEYVADRESVILFANPGKPVGAESYVLGYWET